MDEKLLAILGIAVTALTPFIAYVYKNRRELKSFYSVIWKSSSSLKPKDVIGERPFSQYYYERDEDHSIIDILHQKKNLLIIGPPLSGKSRAIFQALCKSQKNYAVLIPRNVNMTSFRMPLNYKFWKKRVIFIDDLQYYVEKQDYYHLLFKSAKEKNIIILSTCHSGKEFKQVKNKVVEHHLDLETLFNENIIELTKVSPDIAEKIAFQAGVKWEKVKFNGTVGSIFMRLTEMEKRYDECDIVEKTILRTIKNLFICGVYLENEVFPLEWIKIAAKRHELEGKDFEWTGWLKDLESKEFIKLVRRDKIWADEAYLESIVKSVVDMSDIDVFDEQLDIFSDTPDVLLIIGERAYDVGSVDIEIADYMKLAIKAFHQALNIYTLEKYPREYAKTLNYLGNAYRTLAEVKDRVDNCKRAITALENALKVITPENYTDVYSDVQNNIGKVFLRLAEVENTVENCRKSVAAFEESLKYRNIADSPRAFAASQCNLGVAYRTLAEAEDILINCKKAIEAYNKGLKVYNQVEFPVYYASTQNNLGSAYLKLAEIENKVLNSSIAINAFEEALRIRTPESFPLDYSMTQNNLASAYFVLAELENKKINCKKAIRSFEESLKIRTLERFPIQYALTKFNLGHVYLSLAEEEDKSENCSKAIEAFQESLKVRTLGKYPFLYAMSHYYLGKVYMLLTEVGNRSENYRKTIQSFDEALKVITEKHYPAYYLKIHNQIREAKKKMLA